MHILGQGEHSTLNLCIFLDRVNILNNLKPPNCVFRRQLVLAGDLAETPLPSQEANFCLRTRKTYQSAGGMDWRFPARPANREPSDVECSIRDNYIQQAKVGLGSSRLLVKGPSDPQPLPSMRPVVHSKASREIYIMMLIVWFINFEVIFGVLVAYKEKYYSQSY
ncbi:hypothetical protein CIHG_09529 [Coccidioides immitis H538.4]|uniref:Uncharacterized protein n=1 Tax=Coccidioides immitis H538.4 TaxID=396776 RepID=A0A0J8S3K4_COCIT|nr:hypothetical protein CIHG_09529 [Coccidioides immitis H538.4]